MGLQEVESPSVEQALPPENEEEAGNLDDDLQRLVDQIEHIVEKHVVRSEPAHLGYHICNSSVGNFEYLANKRKDKNKSELIKSSIVLKVNLSVYLGLHLNGINFNPKSIQHEAKCTKTKYFCELEKVEFKNGADL